MMISSVVREREMNTYSHAAALQQYFVVLKKVELVSQSRIRASKTTLFVKVS